MEKEKKREGERNKKEPRRGLKEYDMEKTANCEQEGRSDGTARYFFNLTEMVQDSKRYLTMKRILSLNSGNGIIP